MLSREKLLVHIAYAGQLRFNSIGSVTVFKPLAPFDQATAAANQKTAKIAVNMKSYRTNNWEIDVDEFIRRSAITKMNNTYGQRNLRLRCVDFIDGRVDG